MTQLIIDGTEAVLPLNFSTTVKRENSFFTKSGEYTYDVTLRLDNHTNRSLYGFLDRINKRDDVGTDRTAILIADGHVYCRGREIVTRWTDQDVTIQIVSGESELNYFIGQDKKIEDLDLGRADIRTSIWYDGAQPTYRTEDYCLVPIRKSNGRYLNLWYHGTETEEGQYTSPNDPDDDEQGGQQNHHTYIMCQTPTPQPFLCPLLAKIIEDLGYNHDTHHDIINQLESTPFKNLFLVNTQHTYEYAKMFPGWTVKDFLEEVEKLTGCVFVTNNEEKECDILLKADYYKDTKRVSLRNVIDAYETQVADDESRTAEFSSSDVSYGLPDAPRAALMRLPTGMLSTVSIEDYEDFEALRTAAEDKDWKSQTVLRDLETGRLYIKSMYLPEYYQDPESLRLKFLIEVDQFADLDREGTDNKLELGITPAPMLYSRQTDFEIIDFTDGSSQSTPTESEESSEEFDTFEEAILSYKDEKEESRVDLFCAYCGTITPGSVGELQSQAIAYTDAAHAMIQQRLRYAGTFYTPRNYTISLPEPIGSLRLKDIEGSLYQDVYQIDTSHAFTIETYDPNVANPRQIFIIRNKTFVCRDIEEVITAEGRQKKWKMTVYPFNMTEEEIDGWVLSHGVWEDDAPWLDDGRWNDSNPE